MSGMPFRETHRRHIFHRFLDTDRRLAELESLASRGARTSPLSEYVNNLSPTESQVLLDHFARIRSVMLAQLEELGIPLHLRQTSVRRVLQTSLMHVQVAINEMDPGQLSGYGALSNAGRAAAIRIQGDLTRLLDRTRLTAIGVAEVPEIVGTMDEADELRESAEGHSRQIGEAAVECARSRGVALRSVAVRGHAADATVRYAESERMSLTVLGHHGHSRIARFFLGSTTVRVSEHFAWSVVIVK
jgi:nucleotide-binding universal stress UspA family protein